MGDRLAALLNGIERGEFPAADMGVTLVPQPSPREVAVLGFTGHVVVAADVDPAWLAESLPPGDPGAAFAPPFLDALGSRVGRRVPCSDLLLVAPPLAGPGPAGLTEVDGADHPRVRRAHRYRTDVRAWAGAGGLVTVGRGLAGRWEVGVEVDPGHRGKGLGRELATAARHRAAGPLWAQVAPGNAASVRAFLAAGFAPVGVEALLTA